MKNKIMFAIILFLALALRLFGINWDQGFHLHPDERMLIMVAEKIEFFDNLNPDFFNYGSLPIYILSATSELADFLFNSHLGSYDGMLYLGREISAMFDVLTIIILYKLCETLFSKREIGLLVSFLYAIAVFPIQNSHFFIVDTLLTFFVTLLAYLLVIFVKKPSLKLVVSIGIVLACALTTKFTGVIFIPLVILVLIFGSLRHEKKIQFDVLMIYFVLFTLTFVGFSFLFMPYGFLNYTQFISEITAQIRMNNDAFVFPYTLQYVATQPYLYYLKNIFLWGLGPITSIFVIIGGGFGLVELLNYISEHFKSRTKWLHKVNSFIQDKRIFFIIISLFYLFFFLLLGKSAVKFMRYMLPLYPALVLLAGFGLSKIPACAGRLHTKYQILKICAFFLIVLSCTWTVSFISIYSHEHTRITASKWIFQNIPAGSTLAVEHWDDRIPLTVGPVQQYNYEELALYEPDTPEKWEKINSQLNKTDYLVIASNRLYTPLPKLTDCAHLPDYRCYPQTAQYYKELFNGTRGFQKIAEFSSYPKLSVLSTELSIPDDSADESFTVYDHPKILIFKNTQKVNEAGF
jgi:hypothetical protein